MIRPSKGKLFAGLLTFVSVCAMASLSFSIAWFVTTASVTTPTLNGAIMKEYFDSSATADESADPGSATNPFVITRPRHYSNLIELYYEMDGFAESNYYFEVGKQINLDEGDSNYYVYEYNDAGAFQDDVCTNLNVTALEDVPPLGSVEHPFSFHLEGHNMTISGFSVSAAPTIEGTETAFADIGVFGFVGASGYCSNLYFADFTIDMTGGDANANEGTEHTNYQHKRNTHVGYLAGHIVESSNFENVYVNHCTFTGLSGNYASVDNYGYYGAVEHNIEGEEFGTGNNYRFTLDSSAVYQYMQENYSTISGEAMQVRNTEYDNSVNSQYTPPSEAVPDPPVTYPFRNGVTVNNGYRLTGDYFDGEDAQLSDRNFSLSTLGYYGEKTETVMKDYEVYYQSGEEYLHPTSDTKVTTFPLDENPSQGNFFYYNADQTQWEYHHSENTTNTGVTDLVVNSFTYSKGSMKGYPETASVIVTLDDQSQTIPCSISTNDNVYTLTPNAENPLLDFTITFRRGNRQGLFIAYYTGGSISCSFGGFTADDLPRGNHYLSIILNISCEASGWLESTTYAAYYGASVNSSGVVTPQLVTLLDGDGTSKTITPSFASGPITESKTYTDTPTAFYPIVYPSENSYSKVLKGVDIAEPNGYESLIYRATNFTYELEKWYAQETGKVALLDDEGNPLSGPVYIADDAAIVGSGYSQENIDIVGGGVTFNETYVNVQAESDNSRDTVTAAPTSDLLGMPFYATQRTPNSIVLYLKNVGTNSNMGKIHLEYTTVAAIFGTNVKQPAFKKGGTTFVEFENITNASIQNSGQIRTIDVPKLTKTDVQKACYCGIDANRNICAIYNASGTLTAGDDSEVAYYVLAVGVKRDSSSIISWLFRRSINTTQINTISFEYKADVGTSGSFGTVGYRSATDTVPHTLLNFYIAIPSGNNTCTVLVVYTDSTKRYDITATVSFECDMYVFLSDPDTYSLYVNGVQIAGESGTVHLTPS